MTTVTEPPLITPAIDVAELPAWDQPDERVCEVENCPDRPLAQWVTSIACDGGCPTETVLICDECKQLCIDTYDRGFRCAECGSKSRAVRVEALR